MNLTFNVCWIEDQASDALVSKIENAIRQAGFEPEIERIETKEQITIFAQKQHHFHDYELILLDLTLGKDLKGDQIAANVRKHFRSTPLLFYSGVDESKLREMMFKASIEGVYCVHRDRLSERVGELVGELSPALNRLNSMRGLAAQVVANCDEKLRRALLHIGQQPEKSEEILQSLKERIRSGSTAQVGKLEKYNSLEELVAGLPVSSSVLFHEVRDRARKEYGSDEVRALTRSLKNYPDEVLSRRNVLAHALENRTDEGWIIQRKNAAPLTRDDFEQFRSRFIANLRDVHNLCELLVT